MKKIDTDLAILFAELEEALPSKVGYESGYRDALTALTLALSDLVHTSLLVDGVGTAMQVYENNVCDEDDLVTVSLNSFDDEGICVDTTDSKLSVESISDILDHAAQAILLRRGGQAFDQVLDELDEALTVADVIAGPIDAHDGINIAPSTRKFRQNKDGRVVEIVSEADVVVFCNQGGGFMQTLSPDSFHSEYDRVWVTSWRACKIGADWLDFDVDAWTEGVRWNGWAVPYFELPAAFDLLKSMPDLRFNFEKNCFENPDYSEGEGVLSIYESRMITVDGRDIRVYDIGSGEYSWEESTYESPVLKPRSPTNFDAFAIDVFSGLSSFYPAFTESLKSELKELVRSRYVETGNDQDDYILLRNLIEFELDKKQLFSV